MKGPFRDTCLRYLYLLLAFLMAGCVKGIRIALVLDLVLIAGTAIEQAHSVGPLFWPTHHHDLVINYFFNSSTHSFPASMNAGEKHLRAV